MVKVNLKDCLDAQQVAALRGCSKQAVYLALADKRIKPAGWKKDGNRVKMVFRPDEVGCIKSDGGTDG